MEPGLLAVWGVVALAAGAVVGARHRWAGWLLVGSALAATVAVADLGRAFVARDWGLDYVVDHTRSGVGPLLRLAGLWAGPEGSLLLWTAMAAWAAVIAARCAPSGRPDAVPPAGVGSGVAEVWARRLGGGLVAAYGLLVAVVASPFERLDVPAVDGLGLQPVLEYPAMVWHPPLLYAGLLGLLVPALVAGGRAAAGVDAGVERVLLGLPLALLTAGLCTGALWANVELGWGGYWAWDPIESAGLVAWCCGAAALHAGGAESARRVIPSGWLVAAVGLAPGLAAVWATTLTRVGLVASVHAFADRPALRVGLLTVAGTVTAGVAALVVAAARRPTVDRGIGPGGDRCDREAAWLSARAVGRRHGLAVLTAAGFVVAVGAYQPLVEAATTGDRVAIAGHYYSRLLWPLTLVGVALAVAADYRRVGRWRLAVTGPVIGAVAGVAAFPLGGPVYGAILSGAGGAVVGSTMASRLRPPGPGTLAHAGFGLLLIGVAGTTAGTVEVIEAPQGQVVALGDLDVEHRSLELVEAEATRAAVATVLLDGNEFQPRLVRYTLRGVASSEVAWRFDGFDEIQVLLVDGDTAGARYQINRLPRVGLVWLGAALATLGLAITRRRPRSAFPQL